MSEQTKRLAADVPERTAARFTRLAKSNRRTVADELRIAVDGHLQQANGKKAS